MKKQRIDIPEDTAALVLYRSDRTCCVCRERRKAVQIHHIDEDPANNDPDNLAVLCLECHNETQVAGGFGRRLDAEQVRIFRAEWTAMVESQRAFISPEPATPSLTSSPETESRLEHDRTIFRKAQEVMSERALAQFLAPLWNGDEYKWEHRHPIDAYARFLSATDNEFLNQELRERAEALLRAFDALLEFLAYNFFRSGAGELEWFVMHPRLNIDRGGDPRGMAEYEVYQAKLAAVLDSAYTAWREFRRAAKRILII